MYTMLITRQWGWVTSYNNTSALLSCYNNKMLMEMRTPVPFLMAILF